MRVSVTRRRRKLRNEELNLYFSPNITRVLKSNMTRWAAHLAHPEEVKNAHKISAGRDSRDENAWET
jgi:hypothetical protein